MKKRVVHLTSAHARNDIRIFVKQCKSLQQAGYDVSIVVADGLGDEVKEEIKFYDVGKLQGRFKRFTKTTKNVFKKARELNADVYHLHDPELMPIGIKLKKLHKKVIFDAHEDLPKQLLSKPYLNKYLLKIISKLIAKYERFATKKFDYVITAGPFIRDKFLKVNKNTIDINNYVLLGELEKNVKWTEKEDKVCYVGGISEIRGIKELIKAMELVHNPVKINILGRFNSANLERIVKGYDGWENVIEHGFLKRDEVANIMSKSKAGIVTFLPLPNHIDAQPNKMFEYMSASLPIIISNFPYWKEIIDNYNCGILVNPLNPKEISEAIMYIINNPEEAERMGRNGKQAVLEKYNWNIEKEKLISVYKEITK
ncbi:glycosyltransferase family 4 protein [Tenacibaculum mesophilum]|uniref:glycosyltransferase family 4 protein n=1 Tax=Tenacibaculum mesophilum TaxID=104268 RepID=UPI002492EEC3|nr:glycosyltransferase family 4 protein [Tenacibaculum mesophilum]